MTEEGEIKKAIRDYLAATGWLVKDIEVRGIPGRTSKMKGMSDLQALRRAVFLAIEVKTLTGKVSDEQREYLDEVTAHGGIAIVARSLDDVILAVELIEKREDWKNMKAKK